MFFLQKMFFSSILIIEKKWSILIGHLACDRTRSTLIDHLIDITNDLWFIHVWSMYWEFRYLCASISIDNILIFPITVGGYQSASGRCESYPAVSTNDEGVLLCPNNCGRKYKHDCSLRKHVKFECGVEKQFRCPVCAKMFARKDQLQRHMLTNHQILPWNNCGMCMNHFFRAIVGSWK